MDSFARSERAKRARSPDITIDVVAFAKSLGITNRTWIASIRAGMKHALMNAPIESLPSANSLISVCHLFCEEMGYKMAKHLMTQPDFSQGMTVMRPTPRPKKNTKKG